MTSENKRHTIHLWPEANEIVERRKKKTGATKEIIVNRVIIAKGKKWDTVQEERQ